MKITRMLSQSFNSIWHNKARSSLTILGIVIGIASVISLVSLGNGLEASTLDRFSNLGADRVTISSQDPSTVSEEETQEQAGDPRDAMRAAFGGGGGRDNAIEPSLTTEDYQTILNYENVSVASPLIQAQQQVAKTSIDELNVTLTGIDTSYADMEDLEVASGAFLNESQVNSSEKVVVITDTMSNDLFADDAIGQIITIDDVEYTVVGIMAAVDREGQGTFGGGRGGETVYIPYTTALEVAEQDNINTIVADVTDESQAAETAESLVATIYENHGVSEENADVSISIAQDTIKAISNTQSTFTDTLTGIAAISLVVGGIGIMNIMLVTVTERTREIGLRRAVGAKKRHITAQFLTESVMLTFIGGVIGAITGIMLSTKAGDIISLSNGPGRGASENITAVVDPQTVILALAISIAVGVIFGLFPAIKAASKDPVEALRYE